MEQEDALLLLDDHRARVQAKSMGINITGVAGILLEAKKNGIIKTLKNLLDKLIDSDYWISENLYNNILRKAGEK